MPIKFVTPDEWFGLTGERASVIFGPPVRRPLGSPWAR